MTSSSSKTKDKAITINKRATFDYFIEERIEAGLVLLGSEVKSLRDGHMSLAEAYAMIKQGEVFLIGSHIPPYGPSGQFNHEPTRTRKLLLSRSQIKKLDSKRTRKGYTLVPLKCYFKNGRAKLEIGLARGKSKGDKRQAIKEKDAQMEMRRYGARGRR